jgi:hypothetical protein
MAHLLLDVPYAGAMYSKRRRRIGDFHERSVLRSMDVSSPLRKPRILIIGRTGISSMRFSYNSRLHFLAGSQL